jgi:hypothetical protein
MIRKSGYRFSEKDHAQTKRKSGMTIRRRVIPSRGPVRLLIVATPGRWCRRRRLGNAGIRLENRAAASGELRGIFAQARRDPVDVRYLIGAQTPDVRRAGHLLFKRSAIFLRGGGILNCDAAGGRDRKAQNNSVHFHVRSFFRIEWACVFPPARGFKIQGFKINEAWEGSGCSKTCEEWVDVRQSPS